MRSASFASVLPLLACIGCTSTPVVGIRDDTRDASSDAPTTKTPDASRGSDAHDDATLPASCVLHSASTIPHVRVAFPSGTCVFTLAQARAGISIPYDIVIDEDVPGYTSRPTSTGVIPYPENVVASLQVAAMIEGGSERYCRCDQGLPESFCPLGDGGTHFIDSTPGEAPCAPLTLQKGTYHQKFAWDGRTWDGPSDTGNPEGAAFPAGDYSLDVTVDGSIANDAGATDVELQASFLVRLTK